MGKIEVAVLAILLGATSTLLHAAPEPAPPSSPTEAATTAGTPSPPSAYAADGGCGCQSNCARGGSCLHRLIEWATYCPKERLGCCGHSCNSCQYKGAVPFYLFTGRYCQEGSGVHATFAPNCCNECKGCCNGAP